MGRLRRSKVEGRKICSCLNQIKGFQEENCQVGV
jgi:hypothetical protein